MERLTNFLIEANRVGYAAGTSINTIKEKDGSTSIFFEKGEWKFHDNFFGGEPYGGREVIFFQGKPYWIMVYYGQVSSTTGNIKSIYSFLQKALMAAPEEMPVRGPKQFRKEDFEYTNEWQGNIEKFSGKEKIIRAGEQIYDAKYIGGLVDQRRED